MEENRVQGYREMGSHWRRIEYRDIEGEGRFHIGGEERRGI